MSSFGRNWVFSRKKRYFVWKKGYMDMGSRRYMKWQFILLLAMFCSITIKSFAAADVTITSAQQLKNYLGSKASVNGSIVSLSEDISTNIVDWFSGINPSKLIIKGDPITLQLNGHTITGFSPFRFEIQAGGTLVIENGKITTSVNPVITLSGGSLSLKDLTLYNATTNVIQTNSTSLLNCLGKGYGYYLGGNLQTNPGSTLGNAGNLSISKISYTLKYNTMGGIALQNQSYKIDNPLQSLLTPTRAGYNFAGWYFDANYTNLATDLNSDLFYPNNSETVTVYAKWTPISYTIIFDTQGGNSIASEEYNIEKTILLKENNNYVERYKPIYAYRDFQGWYDNANGIGSEVTQIGPNRTGNVTLFAKWAKITYNITYDYNGGAQVPSGNYPATYQVDDDITISEATRGEDKFGGWKILDNNSMLVNNKLPSKEPRDLALQAIWDVQYTITFSTGTDEVEAPANIQAYVSEKVTLPSVSERRGYTFGGWKNGSEVYQAREERQFSGDLTLEAVWNPKTYTVTFTDGDFQQTATYQRGTGSSVEFPSRDKDGWIFNGWKSGNAIINSIGDDEIGDKVFTADWTEIEYQLTYDYNYTGTVNKMVAYTYATRSEQTLESPTRTDYHFLGWLLPGSSTYLDELPMDLSKKETPVSFKATAQWGTVSYPVKFYLNNGTEAILDEGKYNYTVEKGIEENDMPTDPMRTGYTFEGWFDNKDGDGDKWLKVPAGSGDLSLYAKWKPNTYDIIYRWNGGEEVTDAPTSFVYDKGVVLPSKEVMKKEHYDFAGWTKEVDSSTYMEAILPNTEGNQTVYAQWIPKKYTFKFETKGGTIIDDQPYTYGSETKIRKPAKNGYRFDGWFGDAALTKLFGDLITPDKIPAGVENVLTLYAKWTPVEYTIAYDTYYGEIASGKIEKYTIEREVTLPTDVRREGFSFAGWYADDQLKEKITKIEKGSYGDKTVYATWDRGYQVIVSQPSNGKIAVTHNGNAVASGAMVGKGEPLVVTATPTTSDYVLKQLTVNGTTYTTSPQTVVMPESDLKITAEFTISSVPAASAPKIILSPAGMDKFPKGENVKVQLEKTDEATALYYKLDGSPEKAYSGEFLVESAQDTVLLEAIAKKEGYRDGVTTRMIIFDNGKISLTFDLPLGVKATNPTGGDVVTATTTGGSFEFKLTVDQNYYTNLDSMVVLANDSTIRANASGLYTLANCSSDIKVTVSGLKAKTYTVTLQQTENGQIRFTDGADETTSEVGYGSSVSITAVADEDFKFLQWNTGSQSNPLHLTVSRDTTIFARFISDYKSYMMTLPQMEGVTVKPFSGYSTEVKRDGTFKFYLVLAKGYHAENVVVRANGEELVKNNGGYAIYHINKNISISVDGIVRDSMKLTLPDQVTAKVVETMQEITSGENVLEETMLLLQANTPEGKVFAKWNDGKTDNPRMATVVDAAQLIPLFADRGEDKEARVILVQSPGAAITGVNWNVDAVKLGDVVQLKVVLLPAYSRSEVVLSADDKVLTPETSLRAASETRTYLYHLPVDKDGITVKVSGVERNSYEVTVSQVTGGTVSVAPAGKVAHGDKVRLEAEAASGMLFVKWWDGNTLNPYPYTVASDTEVKAFFVGESSIVANETVGTEQVRINVSGSALVVEVPETSLLYIWDYKGALFRTLTIPAGMYTSSLPSGAYLVKVGDGQPVKVVVR